MYSEQQMCSIQGHEGSSITHVCISMACKEISRYMCDKCINEKMHQDEDDSQVEPYHIQINNFLQYIKDQRLTQIELRLKSQNGNQTKLSYLQKIYDENFVDDGFEEISDIKYLIQALIDGYKDEMIKVQLLNDVYKKLTLYHFNNLNFEQLNILIDNQDEFINYEIEKYRVINEKLLYIEYYLFNFRYEDKKQYQKFAKISKRLRIINDYLQFQQYSIDGKKFTIDREQVMNSSFFSKNGRYFATIYRKDYFFGILKIRQQNTLKINQQIQFRRGIGIGKIKFDPLFKYCIIQNILTKNLFYFCILRNNKQFKLTKKFKQESQELLQDFVISNLNNIIVFFKDSIVIRELNFKIQIINEIKFSHKIGIWQYGMQKNIIAITYLKQIQIYQETQKYPMISSTEKQKFSDMMFTNNDQQLLTIDEEYIRLWQIDYHDFQMKQINQISKQNSTEYYLRNTNALNIIKSTFDNYDRSYEIKILDKNFNQWFSFMVFGSAESVYIQLTKHFLIISDQYNIQIIKRRLITDNESLNNDFDLLK